jgi:hypothetical protein
MIRIPKKVADRWPGSVRALTAVALAHKIMDVSEADTVTLVKDMLADFLGYDYRVLCIKWPGLYAEFNVEF